MLLVSSLALATSAASANRINFTYDCGSEKRAYEVQKKAKENLAELNAAQKKIISTYAEEVAYQLVFLTTIGRPQDYKQFKESFLACAKSMGDKLFKKEDLDNAIGVTRKWLGLPESGAPLSRAAARAKREKMNQVRIDLANQLSKALMNINPQGSGSGTSDRTDAAIE